jgi:hypothetical protein
MAEETPLVTERAFRCSTVGLFLAEVKNQMRKEEGKGEKRAVPGEEP